MTTKLAKDLKDNDVIIEGAHRVLVTGIVSSNEKTITYTFRVISEKSRGFGNTGSEYRRLNTKLKTI